MAATGFDIIMQEDADLAGVLVIEMDGRVAGVFRDGDTWSAVDFRDRQDAVSRYAVPASRARTR